MGLPGHILESKLLVLSKCFCLWLPFTNRKKTSKQTQAPSQTRAATSLHWSTSPVDPPSSLRSTRAPEIHPKLTGSSFPSEGNARRPLMSPTHAPHPAPGAPLTLTELSWLEVARICSLSGCQSRPWILERWAARYSTAVLGFCNRTISQSWHFTKSSAHPPELDTAYPSLLGGDTKIPPEELPAGPGVRATRLHGRRGSNPGQVTKIPHAAQHSQKKNNSQRQSLFLRNSILFCLKQTKQDFASSPSRMLRTPACESNLLLPAQARP